MSPRTTFINELNQLKENVADMATRVEKNYETLFEAYEKKEKAAIEKIVAVDKDINRRQREIESECLFLITKQQPIVSDLRAVTASLKVVTDIERVGDHVADIAELLIRMDMKELSAYSVHLNPMIIKMSEAASKMVRDSVNAYVEKDLDLARKVMENDDVVDELFEEVKTTLINFIAENKGLQGVEAIDLIMVAKYLERIADHATNIAEWVEFSITGIHKSSVV